MKASESLFLEVRGLRYHVRRWPCPGARRLVLLHGWMDVSASFQFLADALRGPWDLYAPDWRGYGLTQWAAADSYWFPDYFADLDCLLDALSPDGAASLVAHSLGGNVACMYAGIRPERVRKLVNLEGFGLAATRPEDAPARYARWLEELRERPRLRPYRDYDELAARLRAANPRLAPERARFLAAHWGVEKEGGVVLRSDPAHKIVNPILYREEEARACWRAVQAPVLWIDGAETDTPRRMKLGPQQLAERRSAFRDLRYAVIPGAGHMLHHEAPEALAQLIEPFLRD